MEQTKQKYPKNIGMIVLTESDNKKTANVLWDSGMIEGLTMADKLNLIEALNKGQGRIIDSLNERYDDHISYIVSKKLDKLDKND